MKIKNKAAVFLAFLLLVSCAPADNATLEKVTINVEATKTPIPMADNFSFVFEESSCGYLPWLNVLDTSTGILTHTPLDDGAESIEIPFVLSKSEMEMVYQEIISKNFWDYPSEVRVIGETPPSTFRLKVINGDIVHEVKWTSALENSEPNFPQSDNLFGLYIFIQDIIYSHPEYPESKSGLVCA